MDSVLLRHMNETEADAALLAFGFELSKRRRLLAKLPAVVIHGALVSLGLSP